MIFTASLLAGISAFANSNCNTTQTRAADQAIKSFEQFLLGRGETLPNSWEEAEVTTCAGEPLVAYKLIYYRGQCDFKFDAVSGFVKEGSCQL